LALAAAALLLAACSQAEDVSLDQVRSALSQAVKNGCGQTGQPFTPDCQTERQEYCRLQFKLLQSDPSKDVKTELSAYQRVMQCDASGNALTND